MIQVFKFGGASLKDSSSLKNAVDILTKYQDQHILLVVSAMGKMTNAFEELHKAWFLKQPMRPLFENIQKFHSEIIQDLFHDHRQVNIEVNKIYEFMSQLFQDVEPEDFDKSYDMIIPFGEQLSSVILTNFIIEKGINAERIDATDFVFADNYWREGRIDWKSTTKAIQSSLLPMFEASQEKIIVTQGFMARSSEGQSITLGREGSDFSASIFAFCLDAVKVTIWKDVPGLYNADPKIFKNIQLIRHISYHEAVELAYFGQSIIHPKTIKPLENKKIPLHIRSFIEPSLSGTIIDNNTGDDTIVPCYILKKSQMLVSISPRDFSFINEQNLGGIFAQLAEKRIKINMMQNSALSFSFCSDFQEFKLNNLIDALQKTFYIRFNSELELVTIRNYTEEVIAELLSGRDILLEQRSRNTVQFVTKGSSCL